MWNDFTTVGSSDCLSYLREEVDQSVVPSSLFCIPAKLSSENGRRLVCSTSRPGDADSIDRYGTDVEDEEWPIHLEPLYYWLLIFNFWKVKLYIAISLL